jgi:cyclophilin family peptidyl-prolyl cis-trans isomerase/HEAT repeat protein
VGLVGLVRRVGLVGLVGALSFVSACASSAPLVVAPTPIPQPTFEEKMAWILRLEEDRVLQAPSPPPPPPAPPAVAPPPRGRAAPIVVAPPAPPPRPDLLAILKDDEARLRRRAALAVGRTRLPAGVPALTSLVASDPDPEVRQMAAFALGLIAHADAAPALIAALSDAHAIVQGRAAEALGALAHRPAAAAIATMMSGHVQAGALNGIAPDDLEHPKSPAVEAVRLGMYALVRLGAYEPLAATLADGQGVPVSRWWPVAYAFRRVGDARAATTLLALLQGPGSMTRAFAARGLGATKDGRAVAPLVAALADEAEVVNVRIEAARALAELNAPAAVDVLAKLAASPKVDANLRLESVTALAELRSPATVDLFIDLLTDRSPSIRGAALAGLARSDREMFLSAISGLDPDPEWSVRSSMATALGQLEAAQAHPRLTLMLDDADQRVVPAVLAALAGTGAASAESVLIDRLSADDFVVRQAAASGLARMKSTRAVGALEKAYERSEADASYVARAAILAALVQVAPARARPALARAMADRDWAIRVRAATLMRTIDSGADVSTIRPAPATTAPELDDVATLINPPVSPIAYLDTDKGTIEIELAVLDAPRTVANFIALARRSFLGGTLFHRVVPNFVVQDGDPRGDGEGGPGYTIKDEINQRPYLRGTVGMALDWEDTGGSQFFITHVPQPHLDGRYTVFGRVVAGIEVVDRLTRWDVIRRVRIWNGESWIGAQ